MDFTASSILGIIRKSSKLALLATAICVIAPLLFYLYRYRRSIKKRLDEIEKNVSLVKVVRNKNAGTKKKRMVCMELPDEALTPGE